MRIQITALLISAVLAEALSAGGKSPKTSELSPLDHYVEDATSHSLAETQVSAGSLWSPSSSLTRSAADLRATQVNDVVTILVAESASAVVQGATKSQRQSNVASSVSAAGGITRAVGQLRNLAGASTQSQLDGQGSTSRSTELTTVLSARVSRVLPGGAMVIEGSKEVMVNSERQVVTVRGVIRPVDLTTDNVVRSDRIAQLELKVNGKGVVGDAVRRPFILYRILMGLLPF